MDAPIADDGSAPGPHGVCPDAREERPGVLPLHPTYGWVHPSTSATVGREVLAALAAHSVLGAVAGDVTGPGQSREFVVLTSADDTVATVTTDAALTPGPPLHDLASTLVRATGHAVDLGDVVLAPSGVPSAEVIPPAPLGTVDDFDPRGYGTVLMGPISPGTLPLLARRVHSPVLVAAVPERPGWVLVQPVNPLGETHMHRFDADDLPVIALSRVAGDRAVSVLSSPGHLPGAFLTRVEPWETHLTIEDAAPLRPADAGALLETLAWFADPHLAPESELQFLCTGGGFGSGLDADAVAEALQSPDDDLWSARVLTALGLPTVLADVHEGRASMPEGHLVEPAGFTGALAQVFRRPGRGGGRPARYRDG